jgi:nucleoside-diphosphate-sugar epimerase
MNMQDFRSDLRRMNRRRFLRTSTASSLAVLFSHGLIRSALAITPKKVLVFGGTFYLGPAIVEALLAAGHTVTLFNRGLTNPELFPRVEKLRGFRSADPKDQDLSALEHRRFDVAIDIWPNDPGIVASAAEFLKDRVQHYLFVSSVAAYDHDEFAKPDAITEEMPLIKFNASGGQYSRNKAESERRLQQILGARLTVVRPSAIEGHGNDDPDLLTWIVRAQEGGEHIGPGDGNDPVQYVDVKDVARFFPLAIQKVFYGAFNLAAKSLSFRELLDACHAATRSDATFIWVPKEFLREHGLEADGLSSEPFGRKFPLWISDPKLQGLFRASNAKALAAGWQTRAFEETVLDCLTDFHSGRILVATALSKEKEKEVLDAWKRRPS